MDRNVQRRYERFEAACAPTVLPIAVPRIDKIAGSSPFYPSWGLRCLCWFSGIRMTSSHGALGRWRSRTCLESDPSLPDGGGFGFGVTPDFRRNLTCFGRIDEWH